MSEETKECIHLDTIHEIKGDVKHILKLLNGNGETGLCAKVNMLWTRYNLIAGLIITMAVKMVFFS